MNTQAMPPLQALVVAQAGPGVGLGHLSRALVVARALQHRLGAQVQLLVQGEALQRADLQAFAHQFIAPDADLAAAINARLPTAAASLLALDLQPRRVPAELAQALPGWRASPAAPAPAGRVRDAAAGPASAAMPRRLAGAR